MATSAADSAPRSIDLIVPIYRNATLVAACVDSLLAHATEIADRKPRLVLINDSPDDAEINVLLKRYASTSSDIVVLRNEENVGFVRSVNRGLAEALRAKRDVVLINSDTVTFEDTLAELLKAASADPQIGFACPRSNNASISSLPHFVGGVLPTPQQARDNWAQISRTMPAYHFAPTAVGFYMFISYKVLADHGFLREDFGLGYEEENELVMRAGKVGMRAIIANHSFAYHAGSASFKLTDLDLSTHKHQNLKKLLEIHPEFLRLVGRYESNPHFVAERMMGGLLRDSSGRLKVAFDLTGMGKHHNGTNEQAIAVMRSLAKGQSHRIRLAGVASAESFRYHGLDKIEGLTREEPGAPGLHAIAIRMAQPFDLHHINVLESLAPINLYSMLDTISEDCGPLAAESDFLELWDYVSHHANGLFFNSSTSDRAFCIRHPAAIRQPRWSGLLPTRLSGYAKPGRASASSHILVLGNHFAHKGSDTAARTLAASFPNISVVGLGAETAQRGNLTTYRAGLLESELVERLFTDASVVVLPSYAEGFGLGLMHALAAGRPIVARRIAATEEILATLDDVEGVFLFDHNADLVQACGLALHAGRSAARDTRTHTWDDWTKDLADFCFEVAAQDDVFDRLTARIAAGNLMRRARRGDASAPASAVADVSSPTGHGIALELDELIALDGTEFVQHAYATLLLRQADQGGLDGYVADLASGVSKAKVLETLSKSPEGRQRGVQLAGLDELLTQEKPVKRAPLYRRLFGRRT
jgi:GT2 family glycosyltransferase/glycosyltransferase involved in cell wall biosynthesis